MEAFVSQINVLALAVIVTVVGVVTYRYVKKQLEASCAEPSPAAEAAERLMRRCSPSREDEEV